VKCADEKWRYSLLISMVVTAGGSYSKPSGAGPQLAAGSVAPEFAGGGASDLLITRL
jgi:hypothetical protein